MRPVISNNKPQYSLSFKNGKSNNSTEYFDSYPTREQIYSFVSKHFTIQEISLVETDELYKNGSSNLFHITFGFRFKG